MSEALGSIPSTAKKQKQKRKLISHVVSDTHRSGIWQVFSLSLVQG
jgi:hypothetical protein